MSQFLLCKSNDSLENYSGKKVDNYQYNKQLLQEVIKEYFCEDDLSCLWIIEKVHHYCDDAQLYGFSRDAKLYNILCELYEHCDDMIFWYSSDYKDLEQIHTKNEMLENVNNCLNDSCCEIYLRVIK